VGCGRLQRYGGATGLYSVKPLNFVRCVTESRRGFVGGTFRLGNIALNPYKLAIFAPRYVTKKSLVQYGISANWGWFNNEFRKKLIMNRYLTVALSGVALAAFVAAPALAKSHTQHHSVHAPSYSSNTVVQDGYVLGADPDRAVRLELRRDGRYWQDN
jgi:hypothetical protein